MGFNLHGQQPLPPIYMDVALGAAAARNAVFAGVNLLQESNLIAGVLLNGMFLLGTFTFAVVLGVVSDDISSEVKVWVLAFVMCMRLNLCPAHSSMHSTQQRVWVYVSCRGSS